MSMLCTAGAAPCADTQSGANAVAASSPSVDTVPRRGMGAILRVDARVLHSDDLANQGHGVSKELNDRVLFCVRAWRVAIERTVVTPTSLIVHGKRAGTPVVLKVIKEEGDEWRCGEITAKFGGRGVVQVYEH